MFLAPIQTMLLIQYSTCSVVQPNQGGGFLRTPLWHIQPPYTQNWQLSIMQGSSKSGKGDIASVKSNSFQFGHNSNNSRVLLVKN
eukprot:scaffold94027_cov18-Tisochrysis_lutea.AAC.1